MAFLDFLFGKKKGGSHKRENLSVSERERSQAQYDAASDAVKNLLNDVIGTPEKPAHVDKQQLKDGSIYTGQAILCQDGFYLPYGYGKKYISKELEITGHWVDGVVNGMCYMNMHHSMLTGHFVNNRPQGWCLCIEGGRGFVFGVFNGDDCVTSLGESFQWLIRTIDLGLKTNYKRGSILVGETIPGGTRGFHFNNNGDLYVGLGDGTLTNTGFFFKFTKDGNVEIGEFKNGTLIETLPPEEIVFATSANPSAYIPFNTSKKYF